jgi:rsbT co-antagonist protein RsbR
MTGDATIESFQEENALLRRQIVELQAERRRFERVVQATLDQIDSLIYVRDPEGKFTLVNEVHLRAVRYPREQVIGFKDSDLFPPEVVEGFRANDRKVVAFGEVVEEEELLPHEDGVHTYRSLKLPVFDEAGKLVALVGISTDLTPQRRAEAALRATQAILQAILDKAPVILFTKDRSGRYTLVSREAAAQTGHTPEEVLGKTDHELMPREVTERWLASERNVFETGESHVVEEVVPFEGGARTYVIARFPIREASGEVVSVCAVSTDVTEFRRGDEERRRLQEAVIQAQSNALRELSTPLMPIADGVLVMPLIGTIDNLRAEQLVDVLLDGVAQHRASIAILDVTGLRHVDTQVMNALIQATLAVRMLGAEAVLTGVQPQMAQTLVGLDLPLDQLTTLRTLQSGIEYALRRRDAKYSRRSASRAGTGG